MSISKVISYIAVIVIGVWFIMMAIGNTLRSEIASILQGLLGGVFIILTVYYNGSISHNMLSTFILNCNNLKLFTWIYWLNYTWILII